MIGRVVAKVGSVPAARRLVIATPGLRDTTRRFVGGADAPSAVISAEALHEQGLRTTLELRAGAVRTTADAEEHVRAFAELGTRLASAGCAPASELTVTLAQLGLHAPGGWQRALHRLYDVVGHAADRRLFVTLALHDEADVDETLTAVVAVREEHPSLGVALHARMRRTEDDCRMLSGPGSRVRLLKGGHLAPTEPAVEPESVDDAYLRCLDLLMQGQGYPMVATHDRRIIDAALRSARENGRKSPEWELQMLLGVRDGDARALANDGARVRVCVPYGPDWYSSFVSRIAERPTNLRLLAQALLPREDVSVGVPV